MTDNEIDKPELFPYSLCLRIPLPSSRLAATAFGALKVDAELSPLVSRRLSVVDDSVLLVDYSATTNRMLRVAVNSFLDNVKLVLDVMEHLDVDVFSSSSSSSSRGIPL
ncbi:hypothetical protein L249_6840 [Ophiocordyceps polyrhachis-furcata BCC 54312]|uniref:Transcription factor Pcc1 n=1 Tax=Ophiocordyceps polyrhachis-furcata BCC 54312 TaxID=1330021 RepID=A0A367LKQ9_9HYPO|nr:hypothetical protein L249_6840 [Ophiocordyceps polyrhachis-furcata BCC 54312]